MKFKIGVEGFSFDSAHYTLSSEYGHQLHGHTYKVSVEVEGDVDEKSGFIIDFEILRKIVDEVIKEWDHKLIVPIEDYNQIYMRGPFKLEVKTIPYRYPSAEYIGLEISKTIYEKLGRKFKVTVKMYEGENRYVIVEYP